MTVLCTINMHCASRATLRKPLYILPTFLYPKLNVGLLDSKRYYVYVVSISSN